MDLQSYTDILISQIVVASEIPREILLGENMGVNHEGAVYDPRYFAKLDKDHHLLEPVIRQLLDMDPEVIAIFKEYDLEDAEIDWGLRQVRTDQEQADLDMRLFSNATSMLNICTLDEIRDYLHYPDLKEKIKDEYIKYWFGDEWDGEMLKSIIPNLGQWRQRQLEETFISPEERIQYGMQQAELNNQMEQAEEAQKGSNTWNKTNEKPQSMKPKEPKDPGGGGGIEREATRRESKQERMTDSKGQFLLDWSQKTDSKKAAEAFQYRQYIDVVTDQLKKALEQNHLYQLATDLAVSEPTLRKILQNLDQLKEKSSDDKT